MSSASNDIQSFRNEDLVLSVSPNVDPTLWNESKYEDFINELCSDREYQKEAIKTALRFLLGGRHKDLRSLAEENHQKNDNLRRRWPLFSSMEKRLQLPSQLSCSLDLATGTGKSFVLYGLAAILLAEGVIDRVLVLCPSNTIESGLLDKFRELAGKEELQEAMAVAKPAISPRIINANESITKGSICVENYHAILEATGSSIRDSLKGGGERVLVLNDEAHHVFNDEKNATKRWKEFLMSESFNFRFIVNVSGTCYIGDEYFSDVIYRYSLRQAMEESFVKQIDYVADMPATDGVEERWQILYQRHQESKRKLKAKGIRPLTIVVVADIKRCSELASEMGEWISKWEARDITDEAAREASEKESKAKVLVITSAPEHRANIAELRKVDTSASKIEWIVSVSMLSEGWDVKNVFQIYPHEERAFNSKLLIAQVLGRGLRRPPGWQGEPPVVSVFNHESWSGKIKGLVNELLEIETRLSCFVVDESPFNFLIEHIDYTRESERIQKIVKTSNPFSAGFVDLPSQVETEDVSVQYQRASGSLSKEIAFKANIEHETFSDEEVAEAVFKRLQFYDQESSESEDVESRTSHAKQFPREKCLEIVRASLARSGITSGRVNDANRQRFLQALGNLGTKIVSSVVYKIAAGGRKTLDTKSRRSDSCSASELRRRSKSVFFTEDSSIYIPDEQKEFFDEVRDPDGAFAAAAIPVENPAYFKTPLSIVIVDSEPERRFVRELVKVKNATVIDAWLKNHSQGFYSIEYILAIGTRTFSKQFNPDFFIKSDGVIYVVEIKEDEEIKKCSPENIAKQKYAAEHFFNLNIRLKEEGSNVSFHFSMLTPKGYEVFFSMLRGGRGQMFRSELDIALAKIQVG